MTSRWIGELRPQLAKPSISAPPTKLRLSTAPGIEGLGLWTAGVGYASGQGRIERAMAEMRRALAWDRLMPMITLTESGRTCPVDLGTNTEIFVTKSIRNSQVSLPARPTWGKLALATPWLALIASRSSPITSTNVE
jgi:hypothetical protein